MVTKGHWLFYPRQKVYSVTAPWFFMLSLIDMPPARALLAVCCTDMPAGALSAQIQLFQAINPVRFLVVNLPAFPQ